MRFFYPDIPDLPLPAGHRFPISKYRLLRNLVADESILPPGSLVPSPAIAHLDLLRAHGPGYVDAVCNGTLAPDIVRRIGLPWSETLARRSLLTVGGTLAAAREALRSGVSGQLAGGTHHAHRDFGAGFCVFNDVAVAALTLLDEGAVQRIAVLDLDVHQGDGNAALLAGRSGMLVAGMQGAKNFPFRRVPADIDVELADGTDDAGYLAALTDLLPAIERHRPDLVVYLSGADPLEADRLGRLALSHDGLAERDGMVLEMCRRRGFPVAIVIGGGYAVPIAATVRGYANTFAAARDVFRL